MYKIKDTVYADAGCILINKGGKSYQAKGNLADFTERNISLDDLIIDGNYVKYDGIVQRYNPIWTYAQLKADMVKKRYSNDDQIAIVLNEDDGEEGALAYDKMQEWREWSSRVAHKILEVKNNVDD